MLLVCAWLLGLSACGAKEESAWANGFSEDNAGFDRLAVFFDFAVIQRDLEGKTFIALRESIGDAQSMEQELTELLRRKEYPRGSFEHYYVGTNGTQPERVSQTGVKSGPLREPPYHVDPGAERVELHLIDVLGAFRSFADIVAMPAGRPSASLPRDVAQRIAGHYRSDGLAFVLGVSRRMPDEPDEALPATKERIEGLRTSFLAVGYFEGATGHLVYFDAVPVGGKQEEKTFRKLFKNMNDWVPKHAETGPYFRVPPIPVYETNNDDPSDNPPFWAPDGEVLPGTGPINIMGVLRGQGGISFQSELGVRRLGNVRLPPGTPVRVIGYRSVYTKVVLRDGAVGWVPTQSVWIRK
ncbi:MAG: hypothetical protein M5R36_29880 [Deltaproteobacteria bacterium]|nr:hypothetical protein [Deltaproteobacteria bacterium]